MSVKKVDNKVDFISEEHKILDFWKENNLINTSIKFPILVKINDKNFDISLRFEKILNELDLVSSFSIISFDKENVFVISHKQDMLFDKFRHTIKFEKTRNFSKVI